MALDKLEAMRAFCRIVETGNFKTAAEALGVATTTLSGQIQSLENQLGVKLLHRTTRKVSPSTDGLHYYQRILPLLEEIDDIHQGISQQEVISGQLKIELPSPVADYLITPHLSDFFEQYPHLHLEIGSSERVVDLFAEGVDCAIRGGVIGDDNLVAKKIGEMPFCLCASAVYLAKVPEIRQPEDLANTHFLGFKFAATGKLANVIVANSLKAQFPDGVLFHKKPTIIYNNAQTYYLALLAGLGVGYVPLAFATPYLQNGQLVTLLPDYPLQSMPLHFVYPYSSYTPARVKCFLHWIESLIADNPLWQEQH